MSVTGDEVALVRWPEDAEVRRRLSEEGRARLLVVEPGTEPPQLWDPLEDWVRLPGDPIDLYARRQTLERRQARRAPARVDDDGLLRRGPMWVALSAAEARLMRLLLDHEGETVTRSTLLAAVGAPRSSPTARLLDRAVHRLRRRLHPFGISVHTVRGAGFVLELGQLP